jgi:hypothetical protein
MRYVLFAIALAACGGSPPASTAPVTSAGKAPADAAVDAPASGMAAVLVKLGRFADAICRCSDRGCVQRESKALSDWGAELAKQGDATGQATDDETRQAEALTNRMADCMAKVAGQQGGSASQP